MNKNVFIGLAIVVVLIIGFVLFKNYNQSTKQANLINTGSKEEVIIGYTDTGFAPTKVILKNGGKITWVNRSGREVQIGADPHPLHTGNREVSGGKFTLDLKPSDQKVFSVSKVGTFGYHNHLNVSEGGMIIVE